MEVFDAEVFAIWQALLALGQRNESGRRYTEETSLAHMTRGQIQGNDRLDHGALVTRTMLPTSSWEGR